MGLWIVDAGDPWQSTIFGPYSNVKGDYWNCSTSSLCGNFTDNVKLKDPNWILIGQWHQLPATCSLSRDCPGGSTSGYAPIPHSRTVNGQTITVNLRSPPPVENASLWTRVQFDGSSIVDFNASKLWGYDDPMPICVFPLSGTYGLTQRIWFYITLVLSISDFFPELLRLVSLGNVITTSFAAAIQQFQLYPYRPSVSKIVDLDAVAGAHILAITMWATVFWTLYSRIFGERLKPAYRVIAHSWLIFIATAFLVGARARYWTQDQLELVESANWYRLTSPCYVNLGGATEFWGPNAFANSTIRSISEATVVLIPQNTMHSFAYDWDRTPFQVGRGVTGPPLNIWLVLPTIFTLIAGTFVPRATWPPRESGETWFKYWWRRRRGRANVIMFSLLGPATFCAWPGTISWMSYTAIFKNSMFPPAEDPARIGQWSTTIALMLAVFTAIDHFVPRGWKGQETSDSETQNYELVSKPQDQEALCSGALEPPESDGISRAEEGRVVEEQDEAAPPVQILRSATEQINLIKSEAAVINPPPRLSATD